MVGAQPGGSDIVNGSGKARFAAIIGSHGWGTRVVEQIGNLTPNLKVDLLELVLCHRHPGNEHFQALEELAAAVATRHQTL
ncbi:MAG: hypothetical protein KGY78_10690 [Anaerolineae bacterium]|nr:hypothetical protein [Anaerolineae bacterium]